MWNTIKDGWRYERRDMLLVFAVAVGAVLLYAAAALLTVAAWPHTTETEHVLMAGVWGWALRGLYDTLRDRRH